MGHVFLPCSGTQLRTYDCGHALDFRNGLENVNEKSQYRGSRSLEYWFENSTFVPSPLNIGGVRKFFQLFKDLYCLYSNELKSNTSIEILSKFLLKHNVKFYIFGADCTAKKVFVVFWKLWEIWLIRMQ